jgi:hypothetical protein
MALTKLRQQGGAARSQAMTVWLDGDSTESDTVTALNPIR